MDENTFQEQLIEFFGGSTGTTLGPEVVNSSLTNTTSDRWEIGYTPAAQFRGIDMGATIGVSNTAFMDFNSLDGGSNDYDTRIISFGGETNVNGRGTMQFSANTYQLLGNTAEAEPEYTLPGYVQQPAIPFLPSVNQGRQYALRNYQCTGVGMSADPAAAITIQLRDPVSLTPWFGAFEVYMSNGFNGTGQRASYTGWLIAKNAVPPTNIIEARNVQGNALAVLYAEAGWNAGGFPQLLLFNKNAGTSFIYIVKATVFPDNDGY